MRPLSGVTSGKHLAIFYIVFGACLARLVALLVFALLAVVVAQLHAYSYVQKTSCLLLCGNAVNWTTRSSPSTSQK